MNNRSIIVRVVSLMIALICISLSAKAEEGFGTCQISGTNDYLEGTAYISLNGKELSGNLVLTNGSTTKALQSASVKVSVVLSYTVVSKNQYDRKNDYETDSETTTVIYDSRWTGNIPTQQNKIIPLNKTLNVPLETEKSYIKNIRIKSVNVTINNTYCT